MDEQHIAALRALIRKKLHEEDAPSQEFDALLHEGMLRGLEKDVAQETATYVARYWLAGEDLSDILPRGVQEANDWFAAGEIFGREYRPELLRNLIDASEHDFEAWEGLKYMGIRLHAERRRWPAALADWEIKARLRPRRKPPQRRGNRGQPPYAKARRNRHIYTAVRLLCWLGMGRMDSYHVVGNDVGLSSNRVRDVVKSTGSFEETTP